MFSNFNSLEAHPATGSESALFADPLPKPVPYPHLFNHLLSPPEKLQTVVIDAGHGGHDPGCLGANSREKHIALAIALKLAENIRQNYPDIKVILTRETDVFVPLHERARIANRNNADLFISIHCNFFPHSHRVNGSETYVLGMHRMQENLDVAMRENATILLEEDYETHYDYDPNSPEGHIMLAMYQNAYLERSIRFAEFVEGRMKEDTRRNSRGVRQAGFLVLRATAMPSVLIETGYLSNATEENYLYSDAGQQQVATAILRAFSLYKSELEGTPPEEFEPIHEEVPVLAETPQPVATPTGQATAETVPPAGSDIPAEPVSETLTGGTPSPTAQPEESRPKGFTEPSFELPPAQPKPSVVQFRVQLAASPNPLNTGTGSWTSIPYQVQVIQEGGYFKYQARSFQRLEEAEAARSILRDLGFSDAFIVAYQGSDRITIAEAKRLVHDQPAP